MLLTPNPSVMAPLFRRPAIEAAPGEEDADELSPRAAGLQALGANLAAARTMLLSRGKEAGDGDRADASSEAPPSRREARGGGGGGGSDGGVRKATAGAGAAVKESGRR